ncbi:PH domain-containing protein [uncultured Bacteroides sp.]|uniref:PH domain-containing protein n=1 Tax=uncultured Bacteroides sp. TaxID=162156 RepID=UPI002AA6B0CF|nr:PH domain-containing protein [uncultured Bacteroides sp.]
MNHIFHARITWYQYVYFVLLTAITVFLVWQKNALPALLFALLLVVLIEKLIHTTYTITSEGNLILSFGRFTKKRTIAIKDILSVEKANSMKFGGFSVTKYILIRHGYDKYVAVLPVKEGEFVELLKKLIIGI